MPDTKVLKAVVNGELPEIPKEILSSNDTVIVGIMNVMKKCYRYDARDRPNARSVEREISLLLDKS